MLEQRKLNVFDHFQTQIIDLEASRILAGMSLAGVTTSHFRVRSADQADHREMLNGLLNSGSFRRRLAGYHADGRLFHWGEFARPVDIGHNCGLVRWVEFSPPKPGHRTGLDALIFHQAGREPGSFGRSRHIADVPSLDLIVQAKSAEDILGLPSAMAA